MRAINTVHKVDDCWYISLSYSSHYKPLIYIVFEEALDNILDDYRENLYIKIILSDIAKKDMNDYIVLEKADSQGIDIHYNVIYPKNIDKQVTISCAYKHDYPNLDLDFYFTKYMYIKQLNLIKGEFARKIREAAWRAATGNYNEEDLKAIAREKEFDKRYNVEWDLKEAFKDITKS